MTMRLTSRLALAIAGASLAIAGTILLLRASWGWLALALDPLWATTILGGTLALCGALLAMTARAAHRPPPRPAPATALFGAFYEGLRAGRATTGSGKR